MLAAASVPGKLLSLVLIEPAAHRAADEHPAVAEMIKGSKTFMEEARKRPAAEYLELVFGDQPRPEPAEYLERAAASALHERPAWLAEIPVEELAKGTYPKLLIAGAWDRTTPGYRPGMGDVIQQVGKTVAAKIGAEYREIPGAAHEAHKEQPEVVNQLLVGLWQRATGKMAG